MDAPTGRFAPSTTGPAHPGTLLAALLCWLDIRSRGGTLWLRFEDLDPARSRAAWVDDMRRALDWLGLDWDREQRQTARLASYESSLDRLARDGRIYPCACSRATIRRAGGTTPDGTPRYPGTCRGRPLPDSGWRSCREPLRLRLEEGPAQPLRDESGLVLEAPWPGDPVVRRRDGAFAYQLASVIDDAAAGVDRVVRGRDLASSTPLQWAIAERLALTHPSYRHHLLLLEERGGKLAKLHGAVAWHELRRVLSPERICGALASAAGLCEPGEEPAPTDLLSSFRWESVRARDQVLRWDPPHLVWIGEAGDDPAAGGRQG